MYDIKQAHEDGRHASSHPADVTFWAKVGCAACAARPTNLAAKAVK